ncbi:hypothetical protein BJX76DRAFT_241405 [Aspergillus varians]
MDHSMRPGLLVTIPSSEKAPLNHGSAITRGQIAPQSAPAELLNVGGGRTRRRHRERDGRPRDGIFRHKMHHVPSRADGRGLSLAYREQDSEDDGLLRPITRETTRSRWGSESTGLDPGSRRGSLFDGIDMDIRLGSIKRREEIQSMGDLQRVRDQRSRGEEYLRSALSVIGTLATDITRRLDYTYYGLLEKIAALNVTIASFQELSDSTSKLFDDFQHETTGLEQDIRKQIGDLHEFHPQMQRIETLEERMRASKTRAKALGNRLEAMRNEIERWDKREMEWQMRTNQRLRIFWGVVTAAILTILVTVVLRHWPNEEMSPGFKTLPKALKLSNIPPRIPLPKKHDVFSGNSKDEYVLSPEPSALIHHGTPNIAQTDSPTSSVTGEATKPADYDLLRIFDEL